MVSHSQGARELTPLLSLATLLRNSFGRRGMAGVVSSATSAHEQESKKRKSLKDEPLLPLPKSQGLSDAQQSLHLKRAYARSGDRSDRHRIDDLSDGEHLSEGGWRALAKSEDEADHLSDRDYAVLYGEAHRSPSSGSLPSCRKSVRKLLDHPESSLSASVLQSGVMFLIILSTIFAIFETVPSCYEENKEMFKMSEKVFTVIFTLEVLARAATAESFRTYICAVSNQIDILATSPWYAEKILLATMPRRDGGEDHLLAISGSLRTLRMVRLARLVRLLRVLRIAKFARHSEIISIVLESLFESATGIFVLLAFVGMWALVSATVVYAVESEQPHTDFESIPAALWWSMATISTVGYGDMVPETVMGKIVGGASMLGGILITSIAVAVITTTFTEHYQQRCHMMEVEKYAKKKRASFSEGGLNGSSPSTTARTPENPLVAWDTLEQEVLAELSKLEAQILDQPLRHRMDSNDVALRMLEDHAKQLFKQGKALAQQIVVKKATAEMQELQEMQERAERSEALGADFQDVKDVGQDSV